MTEIRIHPHEARGTVRMKRIPLLLTDGNGMSSFGLVAGARYMAIHKALGQFLIRRWAGLAPTSVDTA